MESPRKKMVVEEEGRDGGESSESVVLQCTEQCSEAVEQGEEVAMAESAPLPYTDRYGSLTVALQAYCEGAKLGAKEDDSTEDVVNERKEVVSVRWVDRGRKMILTPRMASFQNEGGYWRTGVRRRCRARKSFMHGPFGVGASFVVDRAALKRRHEEVEQCSLEADEHHESDDSSSSDSDASDSESEPLKRRDAKRSKGGEDDEALQLSSEGTHKQPSLMAPEPIATQAEQEEAPAEYDDELKEMQELLELQLQAAEKREAGMKQRMEGMMDVLSRHMGHVEKRVSNLEEGAQPQEQVLERINVKLEKVMEGFSALNENLAILSACLSKNLDSQ